MAEPSFKSPWKLLIGTNYAYPEFLGAFADDPNILTFDPTSLRLRSTPVAETNSPPRIMETPQATLAYVLEQLPPGWKPDVVLWVDQEMTNSIPTDMAQCPYPTAWVLGDWSNRMIYCLPYITAFDMILGDQKLVQVLQKRGVTKVAHFFAISYKPGTCYPRPELGYKYDIGFIGNLAPEWRVKRNRYINRLTQFADRYRVLIADNIPRSQYPEILSQCKIAFNWGHNQVNNLRAYEAPACGVLLFMEENNLELPLMLPPEAYVTYNDQNLEARLEYYLTHEDERQAIAKAGYTHIQNCTYTDNFRHLLELIPRIIASHRSPRPFLSLPPVQQNIIQSRMLSGLHTPGASMQSIWQLGHQYWPQYPWDFRTLPVVDFASIVQSSPPVIANELAVCVLEIIHHNVLTSSDPCISPLAGYAQKILTQLCEHHPHPVYRYNLGWSYEILGKQDLAIQEYEILLAKLEAECTLSLSYPVEFSIPVAKGSFFGTVSTRLFLELHQLMLEHEDSDTPRDIRDQAYARILGWHVWNRLGEIHLQFQRWPQAQHAFEQAIHWYDQSYVPYFHLFSLGLIQQDFRYLLEYAKVIIEKQPLHLDFCRAMAELPVWKFTQTDMAPLLKHCLDFLHAYPSLPELTFKLEQQQRLAALNGLLPCLGATTQFIQALRPHFSVHLQHDLWQLSQIHPHDLLSQLGSKLGIQWQLTAGEKPPLLDQDSGFEAQGHLPPVRISQQPSSGKRYYQRVYNRPTQWEQNCIGPDELPYLFPPVLRIEQNEIEDLEPGATVMVLSQWQPLIHTPLIQAILNSSHPQLVLWFPDYGEDLDFGSLEEQLNDSEQARLLLLVEPLEIEQQQFLLQSAHAVFGTLEQANGYYLWWSLWLGTPSGFLQVSQPEAEWLGSLYPIAKDDLVPFILTSAADVPVFLKEVTKLRKVAATIAQQLQATYPTLVEQKLYRVLWCLKLQAMGY